MFVSIMKNRITAIDLKSSVIHVLIAYLINFNLNACISKQATQRLVKNCGSFIYTVNACLCCITCFCDGDHLVGRGCAGQTLSFSLPVWTSTVENSLPIKMIFFMVNASCWNTHPSAQLKLCWRLF